MELNEERFQVKCQFTKDNAELEFIGKIDTPNPDKSLDPYFLALHSRALTDRIQNAICNLEKLEFLNSNGIKSIVNWILKIKSSSKEQQYKVTLVTNQQFTWQRSSINVLSLMAPEIVIVK